MLATFEEQEPYLEAAEWRGRRWAYEQRAVSAPRPALDEVILGLHRVMFGELFEWAGEVRRKDVGPAGIVNVTWSHVRIELRKLAGDFAAWLRSAGDDPELVTIASVLADTHHRFEWIHPFEDTNGRTGRTLDCYVLWTAFELAGESFGTSPILELFPDGEHEAAYYDALAAADNGRPEPLRALYLERLEHALRPIFTVHSDDGRTSRCVGIHESRSAAEHDALERSESDRARMYRVVGIDAETGGSGVLFRALAGEVLERPPARVRPT